MATQRKTSSKFKQANPIQVNRYINTKIAKRFLEAAKSEFEGGSIYKYVYTSPVARNFI